MADIKFLPGTSHSSDTRYESEMVKMLELIGYTLNETEVKLLTKLAGTMLNPGVEINNGYDLLITLSDQGYLDESNFHSLIEMMKIIHRPDIIQMFHLKKRPKVTLDAVEEYLKNSIRVPLNVDPVPIGSKCSRTLRTSGRDKISETRSMTGGEVFSFSEGLPSQSKYLRRSQRISTRNFVKKKPRQVTSRPKKHSCDVRLRVRAEYYNYESVLRSNVSSSKADPLERELDIFIQGTSVLEARDLGFILCDIKFSEVTYLDAFWRDYLNGSLLEALRGVFITESLKQAVGNESIKLLVNVDENDYENGRKILVKNLHRRL